MYEKQNIHKSNITKNMEKLDNLIGRGTIRNNYRQLRSMRSMDAASRRTKKRTELRSKTVYDDIRTHRSVIVERLKD